MSLSFYGIFDLIREYNSDLSFLRSGNNITILKEKDVLFKSSGPSGENSAVTFLAGMLAAYRLGAK